jgi:MoaA/NifB/PqqE/SkfB family radical SAM enzyme
MKISFDGVGWHDWMRNRRGAEQLALDAVKRCLDNGFKVKIQTQVHRRNVESMMPTARMLNELGVANMRIIRTTEVPRWTANAGGACLGMEEYYEKMLAFAEEYIRSGMEMDVDIWNFLRLHPRGRCFRIDAVTCAGGGYRDGIPGCRDARGMVAVTSSGDVVPCLQISGTMLKMNTHVGNLHRDKLKDLLAAGP